MKPSALNIYFRNSVSLDSSVEPPVRCCWLL